MLSVWEGASGSLVECLLTPGVSRMVRASREGRCSWEKLGRRWVKSVRSRSVMESEVQVVLERMDSVAWSVVVWSAVAVSVEM